MASQDQTVSRQLIQRALVRARREGWQAMFGFLEHQEPVLAAYALASADLLAEKLRGYDVPGGIIQQVHREFITAELVCIESLRQAGRELWKDFLPQVEPEAKP